MSQIDIYPWQQLQWQQLMSAKNKHRLPHALLFMGSAGLGKKHFANVLAQFLMCPHAEEKACGKCQQCHLMQTKMHPDLMLIEPEGAAQVIKIDAIRDMTNFVNETALKGQRRIVIISPAHAMNNYAANALLKTLEEPAPQVLIILIHHQVGSLPPTILSRCQKISFHRPDRAVATKWLQSQLPEGTGEHLLKLSNGAPLAALTFHQEFSDVRSQFYQGLTALAEQQVDPLQLAIQFQDQEIKLLCHLLFIWLRDLLHYQLTQSTSELVNEDYQTFFAKISKKISTASLFYYYDHFKTIYRELLNAMNLNRQLVLEDLFIRWVQLC